MVRGRTINVWHTRCMYKRAIDFTQGAVIASNTDTLDLSNSTPPPPPLVSKKIKLKKKTIKREQI